MTDKDPKTPITFDSLMVRNYLNQRHVPTLIESTLSRRKFMRNTAITGLALTMSPWERTVAAYRFPELITNESAPLPPVNLFNAILQVGSILAGLMGFGSQFQTAYNVLGHFLGSQNAKDSAKAALDAVQQEITAQMKKYIDLNLTQLKEKLVDAAGAPVKTAFAAGTGTQSGLRAGSRGTFLAHAAPPDAAKRFYAMTLQETSLNSLVPIFDYNGESNQYDPRALVGLPTLQSFKRMLTRTALRPYGDELRNLIYPMSQSNNFRAYGVWEKSYVVEDRYETARKTTLEFKYEFKGNYTANNAAPNTVYGQMTMNLGRFPQGNSRRNYKFVDTYCWIPPINEAKPCNG